VTSLSKRKDLSNLLKVFLCDVDLSSGAASSFQVFGKMIRGWRSVEDRRERGTKKSSSLRRTGPSSLLAAFDVQQSSKEDGRWLKTNYCIN
jgi:hypothetical protein